jgi:hypothetical protein
MEANHHFQSSLSATSLLHYVKLIGRSLLFVAATALYIVNRQQNTDKYFGNATHKPYILFLIWIVFVVEMILRFFPARLESMGCQKQFARNYKPTKEMPEKILTGWKSTLGVAVSWIALNAVVGILYYTHVIDSGILLLISLAYSVCDMICILFFCPFQTWFMKNKCCGSCRIYNWDFAMMFTPLVFVKHFYTWSLLGLALLLLLQWEILLRLYPQRFSDTTNACLSCGMCNEKLCHHKVQLQHFLITNKNRLVLKGNALIAGMKNRSDMK